MTTRTVQGTIYNPKDGAPWNNAEISFRLLTAHATTGSGSVMQRQVSAVTDLNGDFSVALEVPDVDAWQWQASLPDGNNFIFNLEAGASINLHTLQADNNLGATVSPSDITPLIAGKADKVSPATSGNLLEMDAGGNLVDSGQATADLYTDGVFTTASDGATTIDVSTNKKNKSANTGATSFTGFTNHANGDRIYYWVDDAFTSLVHSPGTLFLLGRENYTPDSGTILEFISDGSEVREIGRRVFNLANTPDITFSASGNDYEADLTNTGVTAASYTNASITVDAKGRVTAASSGSGFDNEVPLSIDLDTPNTPGSVVATFTADGSATAAIIEAYRGATLHASINEFGALKLTGNKNYSDIGGDLHAIGDASTYYLIDSTTPASNTGFAEIYAQYRLSSGDVSNRNLNGLNVIAIIPNTSTYAITGTGALQGGRLVAQYDKSSGTTAKATGFTLLVGASRSGGTVTEARALETQVFSTGTVTTGVGLYVKEPTTPANVTTSKGIVIEDHDVAIETGAGDLSFGGIIDFTGTMGNSTLDPTTDAPADWIEVQIGGTTYYAPVYNAS